MQDLERIVGELEPTLGPPAGEPVALTGGITNRNYRVVLGGERYVVRLHGRDTDLLGIDRECERLATAAAAALGIGPELVAAGRGYMVTRFVDCASVEEREVAGAVEEIADALRRFHDCAVALPQAFSVPRLLERYAAIVEARGGALAPAYAETGVLAERIVEALGPVAQRPCHNDLLPGNIIRARGPGRMMIVDWEYAGMGDPRFDLGNLAVNNHFDGAVEERLLHAYHGRSPSAREHAELKLARVLSDAREAAWGVVQGVISDLDFDFAAYAGEHFERLREAAAASEFEGWLADAGG